MFGKTFLRGSEALEGPEAEGVVQGGGLFDFAADCTSDSEN